MAFEDARRAQHGEGYAMYGWGMRCGWLVLVDGRWLVA